MTAAERAPIGAPATAPPRSIEDRLGEVLRREYCGLILPLWENLSEDDVRRTFWIDRTRSFTTIMASAGLKVALDIPGSSISEVDDQSVNAPWCRLARRLDDVEVRKGYPLCTVLTSTDIARIARAALSFMGDAR